MGKHYPLKLQTREKIIMAQEPVNLTADEKENVEIECAKYLIKSNNPRLVREGLHKLLRIHFRRLKAEELTEMGAWLLANRRTWWVNKVGGGENGQDCL